MLSPLERRPPDAFMGTELADLLKKLKPEVVTIVGVCTDICVDATARTARYLGYQVQIPEKLVATFDLKEGSPPHPGDEYQRETMKRLRDVFGVRIV